MADAELCCRMAPHGDSLCDDVLLCLIAQPGRQAGQPNHRQRVRSPLTAPAVKESFWLRRQLRRTCRVNCGCIIVLKSTPPANTWGEAGATQSLRKAFFCSVQPSCVHDRERTKDGNPYGWLSLGRDTRGRGFVGQSTFIWLEEECIDNTYLSTI